MHGKRGKFCIFLLKIAEKEGKPTWRMCLGSAMQYCRVTFVASAPSDMAVSL
jgi:hypothetical protein